ncbi:MAG TPA: RtcB family protein [Bacteroides sp.]|nr:RtcB family protein [Bacteroides sp.]
MKIHGTYNTALVFNDNVDQESHRQIQEFCNQEIFAGTQIRIMPDVHAGKGCVIGYTANLGDKIVPNLIGLDIGCGILATNLGRLDIKYDKLDKYIRKNIPHGFKRNKSADPGEHPTEFLKNLSETCDFLEIEFMDHLKGIGSLGGGNHFIEIAVDSNKEKWLLIHSGSRNFGLQVATWHQDRAIRECKKKDLDIPKHFAYLDGESGKNYLRDMKVAQEYARLNRKEMTRRILKHLGILKKPDTIIQQGTATLQSAATYLRPDQPGDQFETVHNYINFNDNIVRKGAVSAQKGERIIIPFNMRDGSLIARGKGNAEWNFSAPHGAGRRLSRNQARKQLDMEDFRKAMKNVWTSTVSPKTLDEAPKAYKPKGELMQYIGDTVDIEETLKPVYNFKAE